jgi:signal transduction histidine kinase
VLERFEDATRATIVGHFSRHDSPGFEVGEKVRLEAGLSAETVLRTGEPARVDSYHGLSGAVAETMRSSGYSATVAVPIRLGGMIWGALIGALREEETLPPDTERRMAAFADLVALVLTSATAREELKASRARIVEASDAARRRLERNLHDGAQQRLVAVSLSLRMATARVEADPATARTLLEGAGAELDAALKELRELAQGLHPAVLVNRGLRAAIEALATRAPFPVELGAVTPERLPEPVEVAAYYVVSEALANAAKHAGASLVTVRATAEDGVAVVEIADDGRGGAVASEGSGLRGLADRVEALGGRLTLDSQAGRGTRVLAELPL